MIPRARVTRPFACAAALAPCIAAAQAAPVLDGRPDESAWADALLVDEFRQIVPVPGEPPTLVTQIRLLHDDRRLYVAIVAFDDGKRIARQQARDAGLDGDDHVSIVFDPSGAGRNGYVFRVNANGAQQDALIFDGAEERAEWDAIWDARTTVTDNGWTAELAIPLAALSGADTTQWGFNVERYRAASGERMRWYGLQPERGVTSLRDAGRLSGLPAFSSTQDLRLRLAMRLEQQRPPPAGDSETQLEPSLDLFWRARPDTTATLTLNTDFAEAEVDERVVNLSRFPLFLPEKREFFLQDAGVFSFGGLQENVLPFFSRRIGLTEAGVPVDLTGGLKVTHESQRLEGGLLYTRVEESPTTQAADLAVARIATRAGDHGRLGAIGTWGNPEGTDGSHTWGIDWQYRNPQVAGNHALEIDAWSQGTTNAATGTGYAHGLALGWPNLGVTGNLMLTRIDSAYAPALGFVEETGIDAGFGEIGYWWRTAAGTDVNPGIDWEWREGIDDARRMRSIGPELVIETAVGSFYYVTAYTSDERLVESFEILPGLVIPAGDYSSQGGMIEIGSGSNRTLSGSLWLSSGDYYGGERHDVAAGLGFRPSALWGLSLSGEYTYLDLPAGQAQVHVAAFAVDVTPTPRLAGNLLVQWDDVSEEVGTSLRVRWTLAPGKDVFLSLNRLFLRDRDFAMEAELNSLKVAWNWQW